MSAYMCSNDHINTLVDAAIPHRHGTFDFPWNGSLHYLSEQELGQLLVDENLRSLVARYGVDESAQHYDFKRQPKPRQQAIYYLKLLNGYDYQACESEDYADTQAKAAVERITQNLIRKLPGYDEAPWSL